MVMGMGMGIEQWEWEGMGIPIVFPHTSSLGFPVGCDPGLLDLVH